MIYEVFDVKTKRHEIILNLIKNYDIATQEELLKKLRESGVNTTQATVSRDIKELRLVKHMSSSGVYKYSYNTDISNNSLNDKYISILSESAESMDYAGNFAVVKCHSGMAPAACAAIDNFNFPSVVGTIAGDDTIFILLRTEQDAADFVIGLRNYIK